MNLSSEEVLRLSPDDSSAKAAKGLVVPGKWPRLEFDDAAVWGECQGSGSKPYQVQVDRNGPAFRCTCPSRKFPCKHGLALLLLLAQHPDRFTQAQAPAWVAEWLASRQQRAEKQEAAKEAAKEAPPAPADPQAAAKRESGRLRRMADGLADLERWLNDRLRQGLAQLSSQPGAWEEMAVRMVDAQLPGLAYRLRRAAGRVGKGEDWPARVLAELGEMHLLIEAFGRQADLRPGTWADVRAALGQTQDREAVLAGGERVADTWWVLGQAVEGEDRLWTRRVWLRGQATGRFALLLDHAHGGPRFATVFRTGAGFTATLAFYPGNGPLRALVTDEVPQSLPQSLPQSVAQDGLPQAWRSAGLEAALDLLARDVAANPWQGPLPLWMGQGVPFTEGQDWYLHCADGRLRLRLRLRVRDGDGWHLMARSGGSPVALFGEWEGERLRPLSVWTDRLAWTEAVDTP